ncbi:MAG: T9SS type A sorting domain-containing protein [Candidatus Eisenbacteria bacterium]|nr:T9SS type A sorting domain-containing protein [Candidatus Eisenbacteria bacterium]
MRLSRRALAIVGVILICAALRPSPVAAAWPTSANVNLALCTAANNQTSPGVVSDDVGGAYFAWVDQRSSSTGADIYVSHVLASGVIAPGIPAGGLAICTALGTQFNCRIVGDGLGGAYVSWQDNRSGNADVYLSHIVAPGQVDPGWPQNGLAVCTAANGQYIPEIAADGAGGVFVTWYDLRDGADYDIYAQHVKADGAIDPLWPVSGLPICIATGNQQPAQIAADGVGGAVVVWSDYRSGTEADVYAQRILVSGVVDPSWPVNGLALCTASGSQYGSALVGDGSGGAVVAWVDGRGGVTTDVYGTHVLAIGAIEAGWPVNGRPLCTAPGNQTAVTVGRDASGHAIVAWMDARDGVYTKIYAQQAVGPDGGKWIVDGVRVSSRVGNQRNPMLVADGRGGALIVWEDEGSGASDIYAQHILESGDPDSGWTTAGMPVCSAAYQQQQPRLMLEGSGGAVVVWQDTRSGSVLNTDIYTQRIQATGQLGGVVVSVPRTGPPAVLSEAVWPNPWTDGPLSVRFSLEAESAVDIEMLDVAGRRVASRTLGTISAGQHVASPCDRPDGLEAGLYFVRVIAGTVMRATRVVIVN